MKDIAGKRFGRLTAINIVERINRSDKRKRNYWLCKCDCGNEPIVCISHLTSGGTKSCGCLRREIASENGTAHQSNLKPLDIEKVMIAVKRTCVYGTSLNMLTKTLPSHNTSGIKGVFWNKSRQKWQAEIEFQKKNYYLGRFTEKKDAIKARKHAEKMMVEPFLEWYEHEKKRVSPLISYP